jgi:hypothetical protein
MFRTPVGIALSVALMPVFAAVSAQPAAASTYCTPGAYKEHYKVSKVHSSPVVTNAYNWVLAPGGKKSETEVIDLKTSVTASVEYSTSASISAGSVIAQASAQTGVKLQASGTVAGGSSFTTYIEQANSTKKNREYVYYRGTMKWYGKYTKYYCDYNSHQVKSRSGSWKSWDINYEGTVRCDLAAPNKVSKKAKTKYCD